MVEQDNEEEIKTGNGNTKVTVGVHEWRLKGLEAGVNS